MQALPYNVFKSFHIISQGNFCLQKAQIRTI